ncbi:MAG: hypothetical protein J6C46_09830 [Clostridia bacterium]|nr:hypothetical protein [Clostridia bacterium]
MENKKNIIYLGIIICICFLLIGYFNYEKVIKFFNDREWEFAESFSTVNAENISQVEAGKSLIVLTNNKIQFYDKSAKIGYEKNIINTGILSSTCEDYIAIVYKDTNTICLFKESELMWENKFNWNILNVSVNKNGYVTVIYSQSGYKSSIKIFKPNGDELFTTYLASTYALDVEISNDNKTLYIAEVDAEGIKIESNIKIIDIINFEAGSNPEVQTILVGTDNLITDIEFFDNKLLILKDLGINYIDNERTIKNICDFDVKNTLFTSISNIKNPIVIEKKSTGIFTNETNLKIFKDNEILEINIDRTPQNIDTMNNIIALNLGDEVLFLNTNGKIVKRYELEKQLLNVKLYDNANIAALIFRDKIELVKI